MSAMADPALYSRIVRILKIALPLAALAILSVLFILAEQLDPDAAIPYAEVDVEAILRDQGITNPSFGGVSEDGDVLSLNAENLRPEQGNGDAMTAAMLTAALELASGRRVDIESPRGRVDTQNGTAELSGGVMLSDDRGIVVETDRLTMNLKDVTGRTGPITATGPAGTLSAGSMELLRRGDGKLLVFEGSVRLLFYPDTSRKDDDQ